MWLKTSPLSLTLSLWEGDGVRRRIAERVNRRLLVAAQLGLEMPQSGPLRTVDGCRYRAGKRGGKDIHFLYVYPLGFRETQMQVSKWGNSLAVRLPAAVVEALGLKEGDNIEIHVEGARSFGVSKSPNNRELLARLRKFRGRLPEGFVFDRLQAHERD